MGSTLHPLSSLIVWRKLYCFPYHVLIDIFRFVFELHAVPVYFLMQFAVQNRLLPGGFSSWILLKHQLSLAVQS